MNVDKNGKDFRLVKTTNQDGSVHLTIQTTIHIFGNKASQSTADYMQNKFKEWGKTQSVDNNVTMSFDIFVQYHATMESAMTAANNNAGDNLLEFATNPTSQYQLYPSYSYEFGEKKGYTNQTHGVAIKGGREAKSRELPANFHEIGHFFGFGDRYHKGKSGFNITDNGFEGDIMGVGYPNNINLKHYYDLYNLGKIDLTNGSNVVIPYRDIKNLLETP
jgi:phage-related protein